MSASCNGCRKPFSFADTVWVCKVCYETHSHHNCLNRFKDGNLGPLVCDPAHDWLRMLSWEDQFKQTGRGKVRVGGELQDGERVGGEIVAVDTWVDMIREQWGFKEPTPVEESKDDPGDEVLA